MLKIENVEVVGWEHAIRGMRNPKNSWGKSDSWYGCAARNPEHPHLSGVYCDACDNKDCSWCIGSNDHKLMTQLANGGPVHAKYRRMIAVYLDITAPLYWWKEFDTYKVGTVANSCSTMHKIQDKEFTFSDFSCEHLSTDIKDVNSYIYGVSPITPAGVLKITIDELNWARRKFLETGDKKYWWQMIQLLPTSYNQKRTVMLNYEVLVNIYHSRRHHKLDEWHTMCDWIEKLPYSEIITGVKENGDG